MDKQKDMKSNILIVYYTMFLFVVSGKLRGMNEHEGRTFVNKTLVPATTTTSRQSLVHRVYETANLLQVPSTEDHLVR